MGAPTQSTLIDVVDEADRPVGVIRRGDVVDSGAGFRTVHVLVTNTQGHLLLQQLADGRQRNPARWGSSVAGYLFAGESYADAAARRMLEEIRCSAPLTALGQIRMADRGATKFVHVFSASADAVEIGDPTHVKALRFWEPADIEAKLDVTPHAFTETFVEVFALFRAATA